MQRPAVSLLVVVLASSCSPDAPTGPSKLPYDTFRAQASAINTEALRSTSVEVIEFQWLNPGFTPGSTIPHAGCTGGDLVLESGLTAEDPRDWSLPGFGILPTAQESGVRFDIRQMFGDGVVRGSFTITDGGTFLDTQTGESFMGRGVGAGHYQGNTKPFVLDLVGTVSSWLYGDAGSLIKEVHQFHYTITPDGEAEFIDRLPVAFECLKSAF